MMMMTVANSSHTLPLSLTATLSATSVQSADEAAIVALSQEFGAYKYVDFQEGNLAIKNKGLAILVAFMTTLVLALRP